MCTEYERQWLGLQSVMNNFAILLWALIYWKHPPEAARTNWLTLCVACYNMLADVPGAWCLAAWGGITNRESGTRSWGADAPEERLPASGTMNTEISLEQVNFVVAWLMVPLIILEILHGRARRARRWDVIIRIRIIPGRSPWSAQSPDTDTDQSETNSTNISAQFPRSE